MFELSQTEKERILALKEMRDSNENRPDSDRIEDYLIDDIITEAIERDMF